MKIVALFLMVIICTTSWADYSPGLYLEIVEIKANIYDGFPEVNVWEPVIDRADAETKLPGVLAEHFAGKAYEARLHWHYLDKPCAVEIIATGTYTP